ncbi:TetR/AcrR family transcriptional regulator [Actinoplanes derwentensis]|uniref:DNA-binding transcriptional regulator, AcrR family n=1 Tax=Actinoplanes derwentensis TaxID=113562 RepID=A0A1H1UUQ8_9ACTN|nr:TetR/AcrR family transcriptional regulator [Actinoplanes derwentensis]SDS75816.1 DNA-binding transcriptional regulator, AcrR family [Actinoplanes derwentensis]
MSSNRAYHHGDLRAALITASFEVLAECGLQKFSVAAVARRLNVSSAAPYRHFPDRDHLLAAVSAVAARDLNSTILAAAATVGPDPGDRLAAAAGAYVHHVARSGAGLPVIYAAGLSRITVDGRQEHTRTLMATLMDLAAGTGAGTHREELLLVEATIAVAHGYIALFDDGFFTRGHHTTDDIAARAIEAARALTPSRCP